MANRLGITEAPLATLGEAGAEQNVPMVNVNQGILKPERTTIAAMMAYFGGGGGGFSPQIREFDPVPSTLMVITPSANTQPGAFASGLQTFSWQYRVGGIQVGDPAFYGLQNGRIQLTAAGTYAVRVQMDFNYTNPGNTGQWRYDFQHSIGDVTNLSRFYGGYIRPIGTTTPVEFTAFHYTEIIQIVAPITLTFTYRLRNIGFGPTAGTESEELNPGRTVGDRPITAILAKLS